MRGSLGKRIVLGVVGIAGGTVALASAGTWLTTRHVLEGAVDKDLAAFCERVKQFEEMRSHPPEQRPPGDGRGPGDGRPPNGQAPPAPPAVVQPTGEVSASSAAISPPQPPQPPREGRRGRPFWLPLMHGDRGDGRFLFQLAEVGDGGARKILHATAGLPDGADLAADLPSPAPERWQRDLKLSDGRRVRVATMATKGPSRDKPEVLLASLAIDLEPTKAELVRLAWILGALVATASALSLGAALVLRRALIRPVRGLGDAIARLGPDDLTARLPGGTGPAELRGVVCRLNDLLARLEDAFRREQATLANIAHELRNPVAALRSTIEFRLPAAGEDERRALEPSLATVLRMQAMVSNLLLLARVESGAERLVTERMDLAALTIAVVEEWEGQAAGRGMSIACEPPETLPIDASPLHLRSILDNLIGNAVAHGSPDAVVEVSLRQDAGRVLLRVANPCPAGIDLERIGRPFQRGDPARSAPGHCGLGLALCRRLAALLGGDLRLEAEGGVFAATLVLAGEGTPAQPARTGDAAGPP